MILAQPEIRASVAAGAIRFDPPLNEEQWGAASVDLRLGSQFTRLHAAHGVKHAAHGGLSSLGPFWRTMDLPLYNELGQRNSFCLDPGEFILAMTHERITISNELIGLVEGRSTYARQLTSSLPRRLAYGARIGDAFANQSHPLAHAACAAGHSG